MKSLKSVPRKYSSTFARFLKIKIHISVKEVKLKSMKGKISKTSSLKHYHFLLGKEQKPISYGNL